MVRSLRGAGADQRSYATHPPKALGGALCLDFINTITWRGDPARQAERLRDYGEIVHWAAGFDLVDTRTRAALLAEAGKHPRAAEIVRGQALRLRAELESAFETGSAALTETAHLLRDMGKIGRLAPILKKSGVPKGNAHRWQSLHATPDLRLPLLPIAISAMALAVSDRRQHLRKCADPHCGWVFLDETRNHSRQWCSMEDCGNRAKARAHYARHKAAL